MQVLINILFDVLCADAVSAAVQPPRQTPLTEVVWRTTNETEEENHTGTHNNDIESQTENVQFS